MISPRREDTCCGIIGVAYEREEKRNHLALTASLVQALIWLMAFGIATRSANAVKRDQVS